MKTLLMAGTTAALLAAANLAPATAQGQSPLFKGSFGTTKVCPDTHLQVQDNTTETKVVPKFVFLQSFRTTAVGGCATQQ